APSSPTSPWRSASANCRTRYISATTWRPRGGSATSAGSASRSTRKPRLAATASDSARLAAHSLPSSVRGTPECTTSTTTPGGRGGGVDGEGCVPGHTRERNQLVLNPAGHAGRVELRLLTRERERAQVEIP